MVLSAIKPFVFYLLFGLKPNWASDNFKPRIYNGFSVSADSVPFQVLILSINNQNELVQCGGVIYDKRTILSAAHCFRNVRKDKISVFVGIDKLTQINKNSAKVKKVRIHPKYSNPSSSSNDLAIVCLQKPLSFSDGVKSIGLVDKGPVAESRATISGWGKTNKRSTFGIQLLQANVTLRSIEFCKRYYKDLDVSAICTFDPNTRSGACKGDSGSPLVQNGKLLGIGSFTNSRYCEGNSVSFFVNIFIFRTYIDQNKCK